jgi:hypothetical protein
MAEEETSTSKLVFWVYLFVTSYPVYKFVVKQVEQGGTDRNGLAIGILLIGIDLAVLWWLWLMAFSGDVKRKIMKTRR